MRRMNDKEVVMRRLLTVEQTAMLLGVSTRTLARWRRAGNGPRFIQIGKTVRYDASSIEAWIEENLQ